jgi:hypothetical protein
MFLTASAYWRLTLSKLDWKAFSYYMKSGVGKRESLSFYCPERPLSIMAHAGTLYTEYMITLCTLWSWRWRHKFHNIRRSLYKNEKNSAGINYCVVHRSGRKWHGATVAASPPYSFVTDVALLYRINTSVGPLEKILPEPKSQDAKPRV